MPCVNDETQHLNNTSMQHKSRTLLVCTGNDAQSRQPNHIPD